MGRFRTSPQRAPFPIVWIIAALMGWIKDRIGSSSLAAIGIYLPLNLIFWAQNGLTNPEQGGAPRTILFLLVLLTAALTARFTFRTPTIFERILDRLPAWP